MSKLLVVDDESDIRGGAQRFFGRRNYDVLATASGKEALKIIEEQRPDLVLLDIRMEEMNGIEVLKRLRANGNDIKVIMVTGAEEEEVINEANKYGVKGIMHKPLMLQELEKMVCAELKE